MRHNAPWLSLWLILIATMMNCPLGSQPRGRKKRGGPSIFCQDSEKIEEGRDRLYFELEHGVIFYGLLNREVRTVSWIYF